MTLHPTIQEIVTQTKAAHLPPLSEQPLDQVRENYARLTRWQGDRVALPKVESFVIDGPSGDLPLRLFYPEWKKQLPVCLYFHGGCFVKGNLETHDPICRRLAKGSGCVIVALQYRLAPESIFPAPLEDAKTLIKWLDANREKLQLDMTRLGVAGDNAGGNIAASFALQYKKRLKFQALICPQLDFSFSMPSHEKFARGFLLEEASLEWARGLYLPKGVDFQDPKISPLFAKDFHCLPPSLVVSAEYDPLRDEAELYAKKLLDHGVRVASHRFEGVTHGFFGLGAILHPAQTAISEVARAIHEAL